MQFYGDTLFLEYSYSIGLALLDSNTWQQLEVPVDTLSLLETLEAITIVDNDQDDKLAFLVFIPQLTGYNFNTPTK